jgi:hypothetical protein
LKKGKRTAGDLGILRLRVAASLKRQKIALRFAVARQFRAVSQGSKHPTAKVKVPHAPLAFLFGCRVAARQCLPNMLALDDVSIGKLRILVMAQFNRDGE